MVFLDYIIHLIYYFTVIAVAIFVLIYSYFRFQYNYWKKRNVYYAKPKFPYGNLEGVGRSASLGQKIKNMYDSHKGRKIVGVYLVSDPALLVRDLNVVKNILINDFDSFTGRGFVQSEKYDPLSGNIFFLEGRKWKNLRIKLSPAFTPGKIKNMFSIIKKYADGLKDHLETAATNKDLVETRKITTSFTLDVIASCAFGLELCSLKNSDSDFRNMADAVVFRPKMFRMLQMLFLFTAPKLTAFFRLRQFPQGISDFYTKIVQNTVDFREKNKTHSNDFMQLLIELKNKGKIDSSDYTSQEIDYDPTFTIDQVTAQAFIFFIGGFETSASTLTYCLFELAFNVRIQEKLRKEIDLIITKYDGEITYDGIQEMEYLDRVVSETLRKYPPLTEIYRSCAKPYYMPEIDTVVEKDTKLFISVLGLHHDPEYWPDPEKFDPDRFLPEKKQKRDPLCYLPFGAGPKNCIGYRFGLLETKLALSVILSNFKIVLSEKTKIPLEFNLKSPVMQVKDEIYLKILKR